MLFHLEVELAEIQLSYKIKDYYNKEHIKKLECNEKQLIQFLLIFRKNLKLDAIILKNNNQYNPKKNN